MRGERAEERDPWVEIGGGGGGGVTCFLNRCNSRLYVAGFVLQFPVAAKRSIIFSNAVTDL